MNDSEIIDWLQEHLISFDEAIPGVGRPCRFNMEWLDAEGVDHTTCGVDLRDCVLGAIADKNRMN